MHTLNSRLWWIIEKSFFLYISPLKAEEMETKENVELFLRKLFCSENSLETMHNDLFKKFRKFQIFFHIILNYIHEFSSDTEFLGKQIELKILSNFV